MNLTGPPFLRSLAHSLGRLATSVGPLLLCGAGFLLVVARASHVPGVLDVLYFGLMSAVLLLPPRLEPYQTKLVLRHHSSRFGRSQQLELAGSWVESLRWAVTALLAALSQAEMLLLMAVALLTASYPDVLTDGTKVRC